MKQMLLVLFSFMLLAMSPADDISGRIQDGDLAGALKLAEEIAAKGDPDGEEALGWFYEEGKGVPVDKAIAAEHYRKAAKAGLKHSQWRLGVMLDMGDGIAENPDEAIQWISKSADQNYADAHASMGVMYANGRGTPVDYAKSMASYRRAAQLKNSGGFYGIGVLYALGQGVEENRVEALAWFLVAGSLDDYRAKAAIAQVMQDMGEDDVQHAVQRANEIFDEYGLIEGKGKD